MKIKKVLVSQPKPASEKSPYYDIAEKYGVKIDFRPFIKVESLSAAFIGESAELPCLPLVYRIACDNSRNNEVFLRDGGRCSVYPKVCAVS